MSFTDILFTITYEFFQAASFLVFHNFFSTSQEDQQYSLYAIFMQQPWVDDVGALSHPWVLIAMSESIRNAALPFLKGFLKREKKNATNGNANGNVKLGNSSQLAPNMKITQIRV
jgi:hypothetical protein